MPQHPFDHGALILRREPGAWPRTAEVIRDQLAEYYGLIPTWTSRSFSGHSRRTVRPMRLRRRTDSISGLLGKRTYEHDASR